MSTDTIARGAPMRAMTLRAYGAPDAIQAREIDRPAVSAGNVLVRVRAASVNAADWHLVRGEPYLIRLVGASMGFGLRGPTSPVLGLSLAGVVVAVGDDVADLRPGDEVFGDSRGAFAEYVSAPARSLARKPPGLTFEEAAAVPLAGATALQAIRDHGRTGPGMHVLVNGASGGVGHFAVQIAKALGAEVTGVCSTRNLELVRSLGADHVVDYTCDDFADGRRRYDLVLDLVGNRSVSELRRALSPTGTLLISHGAGGRWLGPIGTLVRATILSRFVGQDLRTFDAKVRTEDLLALSDLVAAGRLRPVIDRTLPLGDVPEAIRYVESGRARGKVVITI